MCVCVCVCMCAHARVCVFVCVYLFSVRNSLAHVAICYSKLSWSLLKIEFG